MARVRVRSAASILYFVFREVVDFAASEETENNVPHFLIERVGLEVPSSVRPISVNKCFMSWD